MNKSNKEPAYLFLMGILPNSIKKYSKGSIQYAADTLQRAILEGFIENGLSNNMTLLNMSYIGSYPKRFKTIFYSRKKMGTLNLPIKTINIPFLNLSFWKVISRTIRSSYSLIKTAVTSTSKNQVLIIYAFHLPFLISSYIYKTLINKNASIILIVPDLPEFMSQRSSTIKKVILSVQYLIYRYISNKINMYVFLTESMRSKLICRNFSIKKHIVVEGIYNPLSNIDVINARLLLKENNITENQFILYSGGISESYGITKLIEAFILAKLPGVHLTICGSGDYTQELIEITKKHHSIKYLGLQPRSTILGLQATAALLVNPRSPEGIFTRYSFPSKTMEYLASGTPTLIYKLQGIPSEYYNYCYTMAEDELSVDDLSRKILSIFKTPIEVRNALAESAKQFIMQKKNPKEQTIKIIKTHLNNQGNEHN